MDLCPLLNGLVLWPLVASHCKRPLRVSFMFGVRFLVSLSGDRVLGIDRNSATVQAPYFTGHFTGWGPKSIVSKCQVL